MADEQSPVFEEALRALEEELGRQGVPIARRTLEGPRVRPGGLPDIGPLPSRHEARSAQPQMPSMVSSPLDYFRASGERMAGMTPADQMNALGRGADVAREMTGVPGLKRAGDAVGDAMIDPSIPRLTNAGVKTGAALMRPAMVLGSLGAGYSAAAAKDLGLLDSSEAQAQTQLRPGQQRAMEMERQRAEREAEIARRQAETNARLGRENADADAKRTLETEAKRKDRAEYDSAVQRAETMRDAELGKRKTFKDTTLGQVWEQTGGAAPFLMGVGSGLVQRGMKPDVSQKALLTWGGVGGAGAANLPLVADSYIVPPVESPDKRGYDAYARELPPSHPRKDEFTRYADKLPAYNPTRTTAQEELYHPVDAPLRNIAGAAEGMLGSEFGYGAWHIPARMATAAGRRLGLLGGLPAPAATTSSPLAGTVVETNALSQPATAGVASSAGTPPASGGAALNGLAAPAQRRLPSPEAAPSQSASGLPPWASEPPPGVNLPRNTYWDANLNRPRHQDGTYVEMPKYRHPK